MKNGNMYMVSSSSSSVTGGLRFLGALTILFIALKLLGHITWSWLWVLSPLWLPVVIVLGFISVIFAGFAISEYLINRKYKNDRIKY